MNEESNSNNGDDHSVEDENRYIAQRRDKLSQLREQGQAYPNHFRRADFAQNLHDDHGALSREVLEQKSIR